MATIFLDDTTAGRTYVARFTADSDGTIWNGSAWVAASTLTTVALQNAVNAVTTTAVVNGQTPTAAHIGYMLTVPAGITVPCRVSLYLTSYTAGDAEDYGYDYDPQVGQILADTGTDGVVVATASKTGYSLAATGLDSITATEPTGKPTTFPGWIMWLVQRFRRSSKTPTTLTVKTEAGATVTTQVIADNGAGTESLGTPS